MQDRAYPGHKDKTKMVGLWAVYAGRYALVNQKAHSAQTYVCCWQGQVVGFYSLAVGSVDVADAPLRVVKGLARYPVPVMILARLAVAQAHQGKGLGRA